MLRRIHPLFPRSGCVWLVIIGYDGKKLLIIAGVLYDMLWGAGAPLVYCGFISVAPEYSLVCCFGMDDEEVISVIYFLDPDSLQ